MRMLFRSVHDFGCRELFRTVFITLRAIALHAATEASEARAVVFGRLARLGLGVCAISFTLSQMVYLRVTGCFGPKVDSAQPAVLGDTHDDRVCTRGDCHSHQSPGTACNTSADAPAGTLCRGGLDSAPDRSPRGASELVRIRPDFPYYRGRLDGWLI